MFCDPFDINGDGIVDAGEQVLGYLIFLTEQEASGDPDEQI